MCFRRATALLEAQVAHANREYADRQDVDLEGAYVQGT